MVTLVATDETRRCLASMIVEEPVFQLDMALRGILQYFSYHNYFLNVRIKEIQITFLRSSIYNHFDFESRPTNISFGT